MAKTTLSNLLTQTQFLQLKFTKFWYITCFLPNSKPIQRRSYRSRKNPELNSKNLSLELNFRNVAGCYSVKEIFMDVFQWIFETLITTLVQCNEEVTEAAIKLCTVKKCRSTNFKETGEVKLLKMQSNSSKTPTKKYILNKDRGLQPVTLLTTRNHPEVFSVYLSECFLTATSIATLEILWNLISLT